MVDDDPETLRHLRDTLAEAGYAPLVTGDPGAVARLIRTEKPQLVLLDLMLPGTDGVELMQTVPGLSDLPVIFISGYGRDETIARALEAGADDYVVKPFSPTELTARIRAALRRRSNPVPFVLGELAIDYDRRRVSVAGRPVTLTATEYELLRVLAQGAGRILTHEALLRQVWAGRGHGKANPKIVRAYVQAAAPPARRRRRPPSLDRQRARGRLPHGPPRRGGRALTAGLSCGTPSRPERPLSPIRMCHKRSFATLSNDITVQSTPMQRARTFSPCSRNWVESFDLAILLEPRAGVSLADVPAKSRGGSSRESLTPLTDSAGGDRRRARAAAGHGDRSS